MIIAGMLMAVYIYIYIYIVSILKNKYNKNDMKLLER